MEHHKIRTLVYLFKEDKVLLAMKKRGFGAGKLNGVGGKLEEGETILQAAVRETQEEVGVDLKEENLKKVAVINFKFLEESGNVKEEQDVHVFFTHEFSGEPTETEEMRPEWFLISEAPYDKMWEDDQHWLPLAFSGRTLEAKAEFTPENKIKTFSFTYTN